MATRSEINVVQQWKRGGFASTAWHSSAKSVYGQCPPFKERGNESLNSLSSADNWSQTGGPLPQLIPKTNDRFLDGRVACWTGRVCLWAVPPPRDWALEEGDRKLKQPLSVDGVGLVRKTWWSNVGNLALIGPIFVLCNFRQLLSKWRWRETCETWFTLELSNSFSANCVITGSNELFRVTFLSF